MADRIAELGMTATPTLAYWHSQWRIRAADHSAEAEMPGVPAEMVAWQGTAATDPALAEKWRRALRAAQQFTSLLFERGVPFLAGSDVPCGAQTPGLSLWREMSLLTEAGLPTLKALQAATSGLGNLLGRPLLGRLRPGSPADLVVVRGNPTERIPERPDIAAIVRGGVAHHQARLVDEARRVASLVSDDPWSAQFSGCPWPPQAASAGAHE
jgi:imidazolonepropionase-like amidohydrolase